MTIILTAALSKGLRSTECISSILNIQKQCLRNSLPIQQDHGVSIQHHAKQLHQECQPELGSQHQYFICWITRLARALLRTALTANQHFSSEVVTKAQRAQTSQKGSVSPGANEEIPRRASVKSFLRIEAVGSGTICLQCFYLLTIQIYLIVIIHHTELNIIKSLWKACSPFAILIYFTCKKKVAKHTN